MTLVDDFGEVAEEELNERVTAIASIDQIFTHDRKKWHNRKKWATDFSVGLDKAGIASTLRGSKVSRQYGTHG